MFHHFFPQFLILFNLKKKSLHLSFCPSVLWACGTPTHSDLQSSRHWCLGNTKSQESQESQESQFAMHRKDEKMKVKETSRLSPHCDHCDGNAWAVLKSESFFDGNGEVLLVCTCRSLHKKHQKTTAVCCLQNRVHGVAAWVQDKTEWREPAVHLVDLESQEFWEVLAKLPGFTLFFWVKIKVKRLMN